jgi:hypothetical protein
VHVNTIKPYLVLQNSKFKFHDNKLKNENKQTDQPTATFAQLPDVHRITVA